MTSMSIEDAGIIAGGIADMVTPKLTAHEQAFFIAGFQECANYLNLKNEDDKLIIPPLGLIPKQFHDERVNIKRFNEVCGAIARYYDANLKINLEWVEEYNDLLERVNNNKKDLKT